MPPSPLTVKYLTLLIPHLLQSSIPPSAGCSILEEPLYPVPLVLFPLFQTMADFDSSDSGEGSDWDRSMFTKKVLGKQIAKDIAIHRDKDRVSSKRNYQNIELSYSAPGTQSRRSMVEHTWDKFYWALARSKSKSTFYPRS